MTTRQLESELGSVNYFYQQNGALIQEQKDKGILKEYEYSPSPPTSLWVQFIPYLILLLIFGVFLRHDEDSHEKWRSCGGAMKFGRARTRLGQDEKKKVTFNDVAGAFPYEKSCRKLLRLPA